MFFFYNVMSLYFLGLRDNIVFLKILKKYRKAVNTNGKKYYFTVLFNLSRPPLLPFVTHVNFWIFKVSPTSFFFSFFLFPLINSGMTLHIFISSFSSYFSFDFVFFCFILTYLLNFVLFSFASFFNFLVC
jgi:hypothetical protein